MGHKKPNGMLRAAIQRAADDRDPNGSSKGKRGRRFATDSEITQHLGITLTNDTQPAYALAGGR